MGRNRKGRKRSRGDESITRRVSIRLDEVLEGPQENLTYTEKKDRSSAVDSDQDGVGAKSVDVADDIKHNDSDHPDAEEIDWGGDDKVERGGAAPTKDVGESTLSVSKQSPSVVVERHESGSRPKGGKTALPSPPMQSGHIRDADKRASRHGQRRQSQDSAARSDASRVSAQRLSSRHTKEGASRCEQQGDSRSRYRHTRDVASTTSSERNRRTGEENARRWEQLRRELGQSKPDGKCREAGRAPHHTSNRKNERERAEGPRREKSARMGSRSSTDRTAARDHAKAA